MKRCWINIKIILIIAFAFFVNSCDRNEDEMPEGRYGYGAAVRFTIEVDSSQARLDNEFQPSVTPSGHGSQSPVIDFLKIRKISFLEGLNSESEWDVTSMEHNIIGGSGTFAEFRRYSGQQITFNFLRIHLTYQKCMVACSINGAHVNQYIVSFFSNYYNPHNSIYINQSEVDTDSMINQGSWFLEVDTPLTGTVLKGASYTTTQPNCIHNYWPSQGAQDYVLTCPVSP